MKSWLDVMRFFAYLALPGVLLTVVFWSLFPLYVAPVWLFTLLVISVGMAVGLVGLTVVGISRLARYFAKPS